MKFRHRDIEAFWIDPDSFKPKRIPPDLRKNLYRKLQMLDAAEFSGRLEDLRIPPSNHLEALHGNREGQYSIRVNKQWRICFSWTPLGIEGIEFVDYH